jgi:hypothetical protein
MADDYSKVTGKSTEEKDGAGQYAGVATRGLLEAIPVYGEKAADVLNLAKPTNAKQRLTERAATALPYNAYQIYKSPAKGLASYATQVLAGQTAKELGGGPLTQGAAEILGGGLPSFVKNVSGKVFGYVDPFLKTAAKKAAKDGYEVGSGAKTGVGMKYGAGETPEALERNLTKATKEATKRSGSEVAAIDESWLKGQQTNLSNQVENIFKDTTFVTDASDAAKIDQILSDTQQAFGEQYSTVESIITGNIKGARPSGKIIETVEVPPFGTVSTGSSFSGEGLRKAIIQINGRLGTGNNQVQNSLLYDLKTALEEIANKNLTAIDPNLAKEYEEWRRSYASFATLRDAFEKGAVDNLGKIDVSRLADIIAVRNGTAANAVTHPLFENIAQHGNVLRTPTRGTSGLATAAKEALTESPISKLATGFMAPSIGPRPNVLASALGLAGPSFARSTQVGSDEDSNPYHRITGVKR